MKQHTNPLSLSLLACISYFVFSNMSGCRTLRELSENDLNKMVTVIEMSKSPCYGRCPVFNLTIYEGGLTSYRGVRYTPRTGLWVKQLDKTTYESLLQEFRKTNLWQFDNVYRGEYYDAPTVSITYYEEGDVKTIVGKDGRPYHVLALEALLDDVARLDGWKQIGGSTSKLPENVITNELIVQLREGRDGNSWVRQYRRQEMEVLERVTPNGNYWLVRFNADTTLPEEMLAKVRSDAEVVGAEFNKKLNERN